MKILSSNESNSQKIMIEKMKLLLYDESNNPLDRVKEAQRLLSFLKSIFMSPTTGAVFMYLLDHGAASSWVLQVNLEIPEPTAYQALKRLRSMQLITPEMKITRKRYGKGGPRPIVWALITATTDDVACAVRDHHRSLSPNYRVAEEFVQALLPEIHQEQITYTMLLLKANQSLEMSKQRIRDVTELAALCLQEKGIKVWR